MAVTLGGSASFARESFCGAVTESSVSPSDVWTPESPCPVRHGFSMQLMFPRRHASSQLQFVSLTRSNAGKPEPVRNPKLTIAVCSKNVRLLIPVACNDLCRMNCKSIAFARDEFCD